jgi:hypothetical protein
MLFTSSDSKYQPHLSVEQHGTAKPEIGQRRTVIRELRDMIPTALKQGHEKQPALSTNPDDFHFANFSIGFEVMGHWQTECEISGLHIDGIRRLN